MTPARDEHRISAYCESLADEAEAATEERKAKTEASRLEFDALMDKLRAASQPPSLPVDAPAQPATPSAPPRASNAFAKFAASLTSPLALTGGSPESGFR